VKKPTPTRVMRDHPDLNQLKRQAKELLQAFVSGDVQAAAEVNTHYHGADPSTFALHDAQLVLARSYGFESWPKLKAYVDGVTVARLEDAARWGDTERVRSMLAVRPELAQMCAAVRIAVLGRHPAMVRILMEHGASARDGVYPHRDATSPLTIAVERGYDEIVAVINDAEQRRRQAKSGLPDAPSPETLFQAIASGDNTQAITLMEADPRLIRTCHPTFGWTPLHIAGRTLNLQLVGWLLDRGADANARGWHDLTPLDFAAHVSDHETRDRFAEVTTLLISRGAKLTPAAATATGDAEWLRARHTEGTLINPIEDTGGLLRIAASHNRKEILSLLLDFGFDPDERTRFEFVGGDDIAFTSGMPLNYCAGSGKHELAALLLERGANPNASVYASGDPVFTAYSRRDWKMVELFESHGGVPCATTAGLYRQTDLAKKMIAGEARYRLERGGTLFEELLWGAACGGDADVVRLALEGVDWSRDDPRWFEMLEQPLRLWQHGSREDWDRSTHLVCFRLLLERCDPNLQGRMDPPQPFGLTILHSVAGSREHVTAEERVAFATMLLDAGAKLDIRDYLLKSTPLGWACRWGRIELVELMIARGADPVENDAEPWATPRAWGEKMGRREVLELLGAKAP
jgi:ankyrin repeat protein